jgi:hypothetical protein
MRNATADVSAYLLDLVPSHGSPANAEAVS